MALVNDGFVKVSGLLNNQHLNHLSARFDAIIGNSSIIDNVQVNNPDIAEYFKTDICKSGPLASVSVPGTTTLESVTLEKRTQNVTGWRRDYSFDSINPLKDVILNIYLNGSASNVSAVSFLKGSHTEANPSANPANIEVVPANTGDGVINFGSTFVDYPVTNESFTLRLVTYKFKFTPAS